MNIQSMPRMHFWFKVFTRNLQPCLYARQPPPRRRLFVMSSQPCRCIVAVLCVRRSSSWPTTTTSPLRCPTTPQSTPGTRVHARDAGKLYVAATTPMNPRVSLHMLPQTPRFAIVGGCTATAPITPPWISDTAAPTSSSHTVAVSQSHCSR